MHAQVTQNMACPCCCSLPLRPSLWLHCCGCIGSILQQITHNLHNVSIALHPALQEQLVYLNVPDKALLALRDACWHAALQHVM